MSIKRKEGFYMKKTKLIATLLVAGMLFSGCGIKSQKAVIKINGEAITQHQFDSLMDKAIVQSPFAQMGMGDIKGNKEGMVYLMTAQRVVSQLIVQTLLEQEAKTRGIKVSNKEVNEAITKIMEKMGGKDQVLSVLKQNGVSVSQFKKDVKTQVMMQKLATQTGKVNVTDKDCKEFYDKNVDKFTHGEQARASHILIAANPAQIQSELSEDSKKTYTKEAMQKKVEEKMAAQKALAEKIAKELQADNSKFASYAKKYSADTNSAKQGGDLGFFEKGSMVPEFAIAAFNAKPNTVTNPVKTQFGYHIIMVTDRKAAGTTSFEKAKSDIKEYLTSEKQIKALDDLTIAAKKKSKIEFMDEQYNPEVIEKKLHNQVNEMSNGAADKLRNENKK